MILLKIFKRDACLPKHIWNLKIELPFHLKYFEIRICFSLEEVCIPKWFPNNFDEKQLIDTNNKWSAKFLDQYMIDTQMTMENHYTFLWWNESLVSREHFHGIWQGDFDDAEVKLCTNIEDLVDTWRIMESICQMNKKNETSMQLITKRLLQKRLTEDILGEDDIDMQVLIILAIGYNCKQMCSYT